MDTSYPGASSPIANSHPVARRSNIAETELETSRISHSRNYLTRNQPQTQNGLNGSSERMERSMLLPVGLTNPFANVNGESSSSVPQPSSTHLHEGHDSSGDRVTTIQITPTGPSASTGGRQRGRVVHVYWETAYDTEPSEAESDTGPLDFGNEPFAQAATPTPPFPTTIPQLTPNFNVYDTDSYACGSWVAQQRMLWVWLERTQLPPDQKQTIALQQLHHNTFYGEYQKNVKKTKGKANEDIRRTKGAFGLPNNRASFWKDKRSRNAPRHLVPLRFRFHRGSQYRLELDGYILQYYESDDLLFDPQYLIERVDQRRHLTPSKSGLCPYCPHVSFYHMEDTSYAKHLAFQHGIFPDGYITPDPFVGKAKRVVDCPVCRMSFRIRDAKRIGNIAARNAPLYDYLKHFCREHQKPRSGSKCESDHFKRVAFYFSSGNSRGNG